MGRHRLLQKDPGEKVVSSTVVKAMLVLKALSDLNEARPEGASVSEISKKSGENPSSVCRHLAAFQQLQLVEQDVRTERYRIGLFALSLAATVLRRIDIREIASPFMRNLAEQTGETAHLVMRDGLFVVYVDKVESSNAIRMHSHVGLRNPMYCTGVGKAILAYSPQALVESVVAEGLTSFTENTLTTKDKLIEDLKQAKQRGYAIDNEEHHPDVHCAAAPILNHLGDPVAAISIAGPKWRLTHDRLLTVGPMVRDMAAQISAKLGKGN